MSTTHASHSAKTVHPAPPRPITTQAAYNTKISSDLDTIATDITALNGLLANLKPASDQAAISEIQAAGTALQGKVEAAVSVASSPPRA